MGKQAKINIDYHFVFDEHYYSVPCQYIHHAVEINKMPVLRTSTLSTSVALIRR
ncbi:TPA: Mu transposase domain-containing protein [Legionella pneumophila]